MSDSSLPPSAFEALQLPPESVEALTQENNSSLTSNDQPSPHHVQTGHGTSDNACANETSITLYAELLLNIRTVTLFASLRTVHNHGTKAVLSADRSSITLSHEGESASICLPTRINGGGNAGLHLPSQPPSKELTLRLQLEEKEGMKLLERAQPGDREANHVPWDATQLNGMKNMNVVCRVCTSRLIKSGVVKDWKDLPNENWAEMMDFWHCHKPDEQHARSHVRGKEVGKTQGYAAGNRLMAVKGQGFVDLGLLLVKKDDCEDVEVITGENDRPDQIICRTCQARIGHVDENAEGWRIWKWSIGIDASSNASTRFTYDVEKWIAAHFLTLIENEGVRKFLVRGDDKHEGRRSSLLLWIFTPDLSFSSSIPSTQGTRHDPTRAMKVFWQPANASKSTADGLKKLRYPFEEVRFPAHIFAVLEKAFEQSQTLLPAGARRFQEWNVGLLKRFEDNEASS